MVVWNSVAAADRYAVICKVLDVKCVSAADPSLAAITLRGFKDNSDHCTGLKPTDCRVSVSSSTSFMLCFLFSWFLLFCSDAFYTSFEL